MILIGAAECVAVGWVYQVDKQMTILGTTSVLYYNLFSFSALLIGGSKMVTLESLLIMTFPLELRYGLLPFEFAWRIGLLQRISSFNPLTAQVTYLG